MPQSKYQKAARAIEKAWKKSQHSRFDRNIQRLGSFGDARRTTKSEYWNAESRRINRNWTSEGVPYYMRKKNRYYFWSKKRQRWM